MVEEAGTAFARHRNANGRTFGSYLRRSIMSRKEALRFSGREDVTVYHGSVEEAERSALEYSAFVAHHARLEKAGKNPLVRVSY